MANKILANPARFTFTRAILWNSFATAFEAQFGFGLERLRQVVSALMMAPNIAKSSPEEMMIESLCPDLDTRNVAFMVGNFAKDEMFDMDIDVDGFVQRFGLQRQQQFAQIEPAAVTAHEMAAEQARTELWNRRSPQTDAAVGAFKFLGKHVAEEGEDRMSKANLSYLGCPKNRS